MQDDSREKLVQDQRVMGQLRDLLKHMERSIRVFEMTYLDLKEALQTELTR